MLSTLSTRPTCTRAHTRKCLLGPLVTSIFPPTNTPLPTGLQGGRRLLFHRRRQAQNHSMIEAYLHDCIKLLCSYDGKILPRHADARPRYVGGHTRLLSLPRSIPFPELLARLSELYGSPVSLRCQLPSEDLDALVSITSDDDFANVLEEYDKAAAVASPKIRAFLFPVRPRTPSPPSSAASPPGAGAARRPPPSGRCVHHAAMFPLWPEKFAGREQRPMAAKPPLVQGVAGRTAAMPVPLLASGIPGHNIEF